MNAPRLLETRTFNPSDIDASKRLRPVSEAGVEGLMASIDEIGFVKDEIIVRKIKRSGKLVLVAGGHRLEACRRLRIEVPAKVFECTDDWASLMEAHDNLANTELTPLELALHLRTHKSVYEKLHPETRAGFAGGLARQGQQRNTSSFAEIVSEARDITPRQVRKIISAGENLNPDEIDKLRLSSRAVTLKDLENISKITDPDERVGVVNLLAEGKIKNVSTARLTLSGKGSASTHTHDPVDAEFKAILDKWNRGSQAARSRFVDEVKSSLLSILEAGEGEA